MENIYHEPAAYDEIVNDWKNRKTITKTMSKFYDAYASMTDEERRSIIEDMDNMIEYRGVMDLTTPKAIY